jgi:hypothetical protein
MLSVVVSVIFFGSMILQIQLFIKQFNLLNKLSDRGIKLNKWSGYAAMKDLKRILANSNDKQLNEIITKVLFYSKQTGRLFFGSIGLIVLIFILNAIFKWKE